MTTPAVSMRGIAKTYDAAGVEFRALADIDLEIGENEFVAIVGPSGSGKSTLMNLLGCLDTPTHGSYRLFGRDVGAMNEAELAWERNRSIGFVFQSFQLLPRATALQNAAAPLAFRRLSRTQRMSRAREALERVALADKLHSLPTQLSGGQRQRVAIARALVTRPRILLGDEPTGNLDSTTSAEILSLFEQLHSAGNTVILVTHDEKIAERCSRVLRISDGRLVEDRKGRVAFGASR